MVGDELANLDDDEQGDGNSHDNTPLPQGERCKLEEVADRRRQERNERQQQAARHSHQ